MRNTILVITQFILAVSTFTLATAPSWAQSPTQWTCQLIGDIGADSSDGVLFADEFLENNYEDWIDLDAFREHLFAPGDDEWRQEIEDLPFGMISQLWRALASSGPIDCRDAFPARWVNAEDARTRRAEVLGVFGRRGRLSPRHPDHVPDVTYGVCGIRAPSLPDWQLVEISRPVFDEFGTRAIFVENTEYGSNAISIYHFENGSWHHRKTLALRLC